MRTKNKKKNIKRWVIKVGSNIVCSGGLLLLRTWTQQLSILKRDYSIEAIWVTSGAIATAVEKTGFKKKNKLLSEKQALSAIGQPLLMDLYNLALQANQLKGAQILLTSSDLKDVGRLNNFQNTIETLLEWDVIPILNENDAVATEEIKFGDNDALSSQVADCVKADLTDVDGLYDDDPRKNKSAKLIRELSSISPQLLNSLSQASTSSKGTGGMYSKLKAADYAAKAGISTSLVKGDMPNVLVHLAENKPVGTLIHGQINVQRSSKRGSK
jgi:glutamate 5-kinase